LRVSFWRFKAGRILEDVADRFRHHEAAASRDIVLESCGNDVEIYSDPSLLGRVLGNLVKMPWKPYPKASRSLWGTMFWEMKTGYAFWVHNPASWRPTCSSRFLRVLSAPRARGGGWERTASSLLAQYYLGGEVSFSSSPDEGTLFRVILPRDGRPAVRRPRATEPAGSPGTLPFQTG
jgi:hypothetical protein